MWRFRPTRSVERMSFEALPLSGSHGSRRAPYSALADRFGHKRAGRGLQVAVEVNLSGVS